MQIAESIDLKIFFQNHAKLNLFLFGTVLLLRSFHNLHRANFPVACPKHYYYDYIGLFIVIIYLYCKSKFKFSLD